MVLSYYQKLQLIGQIIHYNENVYFYDFQPPIYPCVRHWLLILSHYLFTFLYTTKVVEISKLLFESEICKNCNKWL